MTLPNLKPMSVLEPATSELRGSLRRQQPRIVTLPSLKLSSILEPATSEWRLRQEQPRRHHNAAECETVIDFEPGGM